MLFAHPLVIKSQNEMKNRGEKRSKRTLLQRSNTYHIQKSILFNFLQAHIEKQRGFNSLSTLALINLLNELILYNHDGRSDTLCSIKCRLYAFGSHSQTHQQEITLKIRIRIQTELFTISSTYFMAVMRIEINGITDSIYRFCEAAEKH